MGDKILKITDKLVIAGHSFQSRLLVGTGKYTDFFVKIDINRNVESLNISNSAAIVFHHLNYMIKKI